MAVRTTQNQFFTLLNSNLQANYYKLASLQEQIASGKKLQRPSDDPVGQSLSLTLRGGKADIARYQSAAADARTRLDEAAALATDANETLSSARELVIRGLSDTLGSDARAALANEIDELRKGLLQTVNTRTESGYVFGGTELANPPFEETNVAGRKNVTWRGDDSVSRATIGSGDDIDTGVPGSQLFARIAPTGTTYGGVTGAKAGASGDQGTGFEELTVRHDATTGTLGAGIAFANGGASDTILGARTIEVDATNNRLRLGGGAWVPIPAVPTDRANVTIKDPNGAEVHLDLTSWTGADFSGSVTGSGSVSIDGTNFTAISLTESDLQLTDANTGTILHLDTRSITRSGRDLVNFGGTSNVFDILQGIADDLRNGGGYTNSELQKRLGARLVELDKKHDDVLVGLSSLAAKSSRIAVVQERLTSRNVDIEGRLTDVEDVDISTAVIEITRTQQTLELVQATGSKLVQTNLLNYLR